MLWRLLHNFYSDDDWWCNDDDDDRWYDEEEKGEKWREEWTWKNLSPCFYCITGPCRKTQEEWRPPSDSVVRSDQSLRKPAERTNEIISNRFHWSASLVSRSNSTSFPQQLIWSHNRVRKEIGHLKNNKKKRISMTPSLTYLLKQ